MSACYYAHVDRLVYGARLTDMARFTEDELSVRPDELIRNQPRQVEIIGDFMRDACVDLLDRWSKQRSTMTG